MRPARIFEALRRVRGRAVVALVAGLTTALAMAGGPAHAQSAAPAGTTVWPSDRCPESLGPLVHMPGLVIGCWCAADAEPGAVWGSGPYTGDSNLCGVGRHAGVIGAAGGALWIKLTPGQEAYTGSTANGVTTADYGPYGASIDVVDRLGDACPATMAGLNGTIGCTCAPSRFGSAAVWGTDIYTDDSSVCDAALHAGAVTAKGGRVTVTAGPGRASYAGSVRNGVTSLDYGGWGGSFSFTQ